MTPEKAYYHACKYGPSVGTRITASQNTLFSIWYAIDVDMGPHEDTRKGACQTPTAAFKYAEDIDKGPHEDTRKGACRRY